MNTSVWFNEQRHAMVALDQLLQLSQQLRDVTDSSLQGVASRKPESRTLHLFISPQNQPRDHHGPLPWPRSSRPYRAGSRQFGDQFSGSQ